MNLTAKIVRLHDTLSRAALPHAFGGALALAWCTQRARGTIDIDVNIFVGTDAAADALRGLPRQVARSDADLTALHTDGQVRLWWDATPVDVFLNTTEFHEQAAARARLEPFAGRQMPFLACDDLAVFKAFFNRSKDWVDLEEMITAGALDIDRVVGVLDRYLGSNDERIDRLRSLRDR